MAFKKGEIFGWNPSKSKKEKEGRNNIFPKKKKRGKKNIIHEVDSRTSLPPQICQI